MPQAIAAALLPVLASGLGITAGYVVATAVGYLATAAILYGASALISTAFAPPKPETPKPEDGKYNLKQPVPPLVYVVGRVKKGGDYVFLEEKGGTAFHVMVDAAHSIEGYVGHWLHDEEVTLAGTGRVTVPGHFRQKVVIRTREGADAETAYAQLVTTFPTIWTEDHRGDGLASVLMWVNSADAEDHQKTFPQGMPQRTSIIDGNNRIFDPRNEDHDQEDPHTWSYTTNIALHRLWHLTHPVGGKLTLDDMYLPDWANAADVCDEEVTNRSGGTLSRYHGGFWFRANNDPVEVGRTMDQAAELVLYERADGKIGVHAGEYVAPDIRLTADHIVSISYDPNKRKSSSVLAVRGRWTDPEKGYTTVDAAIYGDPYEDSTERTKTVENVAVQEHNHIARLQKLAFTRANAPRVKVVAHYEPARNVPYHRFITIHYPNRNMDEAVIELIGRPTLSLRNLTYEFEGIVVPSALYDFNAAAEEGAPGTAIVLVDRDDVPVPDVDSITLATEVVSGGSTAAYIEVVFNEQHDSFQYQVEWEPKAGGTAQSATTAAGELTARTGYLADGVEYQVRVRTWSSGTPSDWSDYTDITATADPVAPGAVTAVSATGGVGEAELEWTAPNSSNYFASRIYLNTDDDFGTATLAATEFGSPGAVDTRAVTGLAAETYFGWIVAINASGVAATEVATGNFIVTY